MPYDENKANNAVKFIKRLKHTKGEWAGHPFNLLKYQEDEIIRPLFGTIKKDGYRQYRFCYVELPKKSGKSELAGAVSLLCYYADKEIGGEVYLAAGDKDQASIVFNVGASMVRQNKALLSRTDIIDSRKRMYLLKTNSVYAALSRETSTKHGYNPSCVVIDELHAHKNRELYDVLVEGTDSARRQQLIFIITTAGIYDKTSIGWEVHEYARKVKDGIIKDPTFLPIIYAADQKADWTDEKVWKEVNPSLGHIIDLEKVRDHFKQVKNVPSRQNNFRRFRLNQWVSQLVRWMPMEEWDVCGQEKVNIESLRGRKCYGGLDLASTTDIAAYALVFPPEEEMEPYKALLYFWIPDENMHERALNDNVPYEMWVRAGLIEATEGNTINYAFIEAAISMTAEMFDVQEIAFDRWGATKMIQALEDLGFSGDPDATGRLLIKFGQGYKSMSPPTKELLNMALTRKISHGGNPVLRWMADNMVVRTDPAGNIKPDKERSKEKIDGIVALIMALDRALRDEFEESAYADRGVLVF